MTTKRQLLIQPYDPDETENLGDNTGQFSSNDIGKAVVYNGDQMDQAASGNPIVGFIQSVEPGTQDGHSQGSVRKTGRVKALDEAGTLTVGDVVVAGTAGTLGTLALANVVVEPTPGTSAGRFPWMVIAVYGTGAGRECLLQRI